MSTPAFPAALLSPTVARNRDPILAVLRRFARQGHGAGDRERYRRARGAFRAQFPHSPGSRPMSTRRDRQHRSDRAAVNAPNLRAPIILECHRTDLAGGARRCRGVDEHDPHFTMGGGAGADVRRRAASLGRRAALSLRAVGKMASTPRRATRRSTQACARAIPRGACATPATSARSPTATASISSSALRCRRTISVSCSCGVRNNEGVIQTPSVVPHALSNLPFARSAARSSEFVWS